MNFKPLGDRILVKRLETEDVTAGGLIIPDAAKEKPSEGTVMAVGTDDDLSVEVGNTVLFGKWSGTEIELDGQSMLIVKETDILGIVS
jgi:chaperonin GroES